MVAEQSTASCELRQVVIPSPQDAWRSFADLRGSNEVGEKGQQLQVEELSEDVRLHCCDPPASLQPQRQLQPQPGQAPHQGQPGSPDTSVCVAPSADAGTGEQESGEGGGGGAGGPVAAQARTREGLAEDAGAGEERLLPAGKAPPLLLLRDEEEGGARGGGGGGGGVGGGFFHSFRIARAARTTYCSSFSIAVWTVVCVLDWIDAWPDGDESSSSSSSSWRVWSQAVTLTTWTCSLLALLAGTLAARRRARRVHPLGSGTLPAAASAVASAAASPAAVGGSDGVAHSNSSTKVVPTVGTTTAAQGPTAEESPAPASSPASASASAGAIAAASEDRGSAGTATPASAAAGSVASPPSRTWFLLHSFGGETQAAQASRAAAQAAPHPLPLPLPRPLPLPLPLPLPPLGSARSLPLRPLRPLHLPHRLLPCLPCVSCLSCLSCLPCLPYGAPPRLRHSLDALVHVILLLGCIVWITVRLLLLCGSSSSSSSSSGDPREEGGALFCRDGDDSQGAMEREVPVIVAFAALLLLLVSAMLAAWLALANSSTTVVLVSHDSLAATSLALNLTSSEPLEHLACRQKRWRRLFADPTFYWEHFPSELHSPSSSNVLPESGAPSRTSSFGLNQLPRLRALSVSGRASLIAGSIRGKLLRSASSVAVSDRSIRENDREGRGSSFASSTSSCDSAFSDVSAAVEGAGKGKGAAASASASARKKEMGKDMSKHSEDAANDDDDVNGTAPSERSLLRAAAVGVHATAVAASGTFATVATAASPGSGGGAKLASQARMCQQASQASVCTPVSAFRATSRSGSRSSSSAFSDVSGDDRPQQSKLNLAVPARSASRCSSENGSVASGRSSKEAVEPTQSRVSAFSDVSSVAPN